MKITFHIYMYIDAPHKEDRAKTNNDIIVPILSKYAPSLQSKLYEPSFPGTVKDAFEISTQYGKTV